MIMNPHYYNYSEDYRVRVTPLKTQEDSASESGSLSQFEKAQNNNWLVDPLKLEEGGMNDMYYGKSKDNVVKLIDSVIKSRVQVTNNFQDKTTLNALPALEIWTKNMTPLALLKYLRSYFFTAISDTPEKVSSDDEEVPEDTDIYKIYNSLSIPTESLYLKINKNFPDSIFYELEKNLLSLESDQDVSLSNMKRLKTDLETAELYLRLFNVFILVLLFLLAFFLLLVFFMNMIRERRWEFAVLRAVGYKLRDIRGIYLLEMGSNVLSALLLGALTGFIFSSLSSMQFSIFNEIKLR
jgi:ABC-type antimicrobial peptide transport system permease subunit